MAYLRSGQNLNLALIFLEEAELPAFPIINPKITKVSAETTLVEEGCLSMPGVYGLVERPKKITMEAYDISGKKFIVTDDTFLARVLQHEIDHLQNIIIIDKLHKITQGEPLLGQFKESL